MNELDKLYRSIIMDHYKNPQNKGLKEDEHYGHVHAKNATCGDDVTVQAIVENGIIKDINFDGKGCSISMSSASIMTETLVGRTVLEAKTIIENFYQIIEGNNYDDSLDYGDAEVYAGVNEFPARVKCAGLPWHAMDELINGENNGK